MNINKLLNAKRVTVKYLDADINKEDVKDFRKQFDLTQVAAANILGVTKKAVEKWEQGANKVGGSSAILIKLILDEPTLLSKLYSVNVVENSYTENIVIAKISSTQMPFEKTEEITFKTFNPSSSKLVLCGGV